jgi:hypothetical protein
MLSGLGISDDWAYSTKPGIMTDFVSAYLW